MKSKGKSFYKIVNEEGKIIARGFYNKCCASQMLPSYKLTKCDKLKVVEE